MSRDLGTGGVVKRLLLTLSLVLFAFAAHAQTQDDRFPKPSDKNPSLISVVRSWFAPKSAPVTTKSARPKAKAASARAQPLATASSTKNPAPIRSKPASGPKKLALITPAPLAPAQPPRRATGCNGQRVISDYYGHGSRTASGQPFNPHGLTAAHRTLPFGTRLTVTNPRTGKSVTVVVNDRGPFTRGVSLDLSLGAAKAIGMTGRGQVCMS